MSSESPEPIEWTLSEESSGTRLDKVVAEYLECPRNRVQRWLREDRIQVDGKPGKAGKVLIAGQRIAVQPPPVEDDERLIPEPGELEVLFEDEHLVVINKPHGIAVHPGAGRSTGTLAHYLVHRYPEMRAVGGPGRPGIVHRLDLDTTGVMVVAKTDPAYLGLADAFAERRINKTYCAVVHGMLRAAVTLDQPIGRHPHDRKQMTIRSDGRSSISHVKPLAVVEQVASAVEIGLETGRTHQIRVHMKAARYPLVGDPVYGEARWKGAPTRFRRTLERFPRPALHAQKLQFVHPVTEKDLEVTAPIPDDLIALWTKLSGTPWPKG